MEEFTRRDEALAPERAYLALGRNAARTTGRDLDSGAFPLFHASAQFSSAAKAAEGAGSAAAGASFTGPERMAKSGPEQAPAAQTRGGHSTHSSEAHNNGDAHAGVVGGGMELRSAERAFMGDAAESPSANGDEQKNAGKDPEEKSADPAAKLTKEEQQQVEELQKRDQEVRSHEQAHISAGGSLVSGGASFETTRGPDGKSYAVGGEVQIDTSEGANPETTLEKARQVQAAALAPAEPSAQDRQVAAEASRMMTQARTEQHAAKAEESENTRGSGPGQNAESKEGAAPEETREQPVGFVQAVRHYQKAAHSYRRVSGARPPALYGIAFSLAV